MKKSLVLGIAGWALIASSAGQAAAQPAAATSPLVAVSLYGTASSRAAVCGADCTAMAAAAAQYGDTEARDGSQLFILLGAVAALVAAYILLKDTVLSGGGDIEVNPGVPVSPA